MSAKPTNRLEESLVKAALDPAHRPQFYRDLLASDIYVIQEGPPPDRPGHRVLPAGELLKIRTLSFNGKQYVPIFSSRAALQAALSEEAAYLALNAAEFFRITAGADVVLNPGWDHGKEFSKEEIAGLLDGSIWQPRERFAVKRDTTVQIGQPARHPKELVETLSRLFTDPRGAQGVCRAVLQPGGGRAPPHAGGDRGVGQLGIRRRPGGHRRAAALR